MPEQITPMSILYLLLHGAGTGVSVVLCLYLLLCRGKATHIGQLLAKHCEDTQLYLQTDLTLSQLSAAVGVNRYYLSQYFASQDTSYYEYIHNLRIRHFIARYRELAASEKFISAQQLARESGYHSYSTFSTAFKQRMHKSVTAWMHEEE